MGIIGLLYVLSIWAVCLMIGYSIAAMILKASCSLVGAPVPDTGLAIVTCVLESVVGGILKFNVGLGLGYLGSKAQDVLPEIAVFACAALIGIGVVVPAGVYMPMLRVSFGKGVAISLIRYVITTAIAAVVILLLMGIMGKSFPKLV
jgi:hypothetical protein